MRNKSKLDNKISRWSDALINILFIVFSICCLYPVGLVIGTSFSDELYLQEFGYKLFPKVTSTYAYEYILANAEAILRAYGITIFVTIIGTVLGTLFIALYAYAISRRNFKFRKFFTFAMFFTMLFSIYYCYRNRRNDKGML